METTRSRPNILVTGTPGTGKTSLCARLAEDIGFKNINCGDVVKEKECHEGWDDEFQCYTLDEDKLVDELEEQMTDGGVVVDFHTVDFFPERWFDLVVVLTCDNSTLWPRLQKRGYSDKKINENMECEIMQVVMTEARESYDENIVVVLKSESLDDLEQNVQRIGTWVMQWLKDHE